MWEQGDVLCQTNFSLLSSGLKIPAIFSLVETFCDNGSVPFWNVAFSSLRIWNDSFVSRPSLMSTFPLSLFPLVPIFSKIGDSYWNIIVTFCTSYAVGILNYSIFGGYLSSGRKNNIIILYIYLNYLIGMVT